MQPAADCANQRATVTLAALLKLIAGVSHEINNPLTAVQGLSELLANEETDSQKREDLEVIAQESARAIAIVRNLRAFARTPAGEPGPTDLNRALSQVVDARGYETRARGISLATSFDPQTPPVLAHCENLALIGLLLLLEAERLCVPARPLGQVEAEHAPRDPAIEMGTRADSTGSHAYVEVTEPTAMPTEPMADAVIVCKQIAAESGGTISIEADERRGVVVYSVSFAAA